MTNLRNDLMGHPVRLLIVDDEAHIRSLLVKALGLAGYHVEEAASGDEALALLERSWYDLMVLDMLMPGMKGPEVLRRARELKPELLIVVLTGNATLENAIVAIKTAAADYLLKPISIHEIIDAITKALQKRMAQVQKDYLDEVLGDSMEISHQLEDPLVSPFSGGERWSRFVHAHPLRLDRSQRTVEFEEASLPAIILSKGETAVLASLMENADHVLSCQHLVQASWGYKLDQIEAESVIRPYISRLRSKIETNPKKPVLIRTIRRRGYQFVVKKP